MTPKDHRDAWAAQHPSIAHQLRDHPARHVLNDSLRPTVHTLTGDRAAYARQLERLELEQWLARTLGTTRDGLLDYAAEVTA